MAFAQRQTIADAVFKDLWDLFLSDEIPAVFTIRRLEKAAKDLVATDAAEASIVSAAVGALQWDISACRHWIDNAIRIAPNNPAVLHNASVTLQKVNLMDASADLAIRAYQTTPLDREVVRWAILAANGAGRFAESLHLLSDAKSNKVEGVAVPKIDHIVDAMRALGVKPEQLHKEISVAFEVLTASRKRARDLQHGVFSDHDGTKSLYMTLGFLGTIEDELRLNAQLAERLVDMPDWNPDVLSTELRYIPTPAHVHETI